MNSKRFSTITLATLVVVLTALAGCTPSSHFQPRSFTTEEAGTLRLGDRPSEVRLLIGAPHYIYTAEMGSELGDAWEGVVWEYLGSLNPVYTITKKRLRNRLVFAIVEGDTLLNNWDLEDVIEELPAK